MSEQICRIVCSSDGDCPTGLTCFDTMIFGQRCINPANIPGM
jgi:hypothetical protein